MIVEFHISGSIEETVERLRTELEGKGFAFSENEKSYAVHYSNGQINKTQTGSRFWARKQLGPPYPSTTSIEVEGEIVQSEGRTIVKTDFIENHANRRHGAGGSRAIDEYVDFFCEIFRYEQRG
jgi:hypothetical protein